MVKAKSSSLVYLAVAAMFAVVLAPAQTAALQQSNDHASHINPPPPQLSRTLTTVP